jgi:hypothetical protein
MVIFWLASMGALAATRATFIYPTTINDCVNLGVGDSYCNKLRRRQYVASDGYLAMMSGAAGLSALEMFVSLIPRIIRIRKNKHSPVLFQDSLRHNSHGSQHTPQTLPLRCQAYSTL